ncbi:MAG: hypothetical protein A2287_09885 [Candidatus Melainabacteria bacterium RIFOXYA12_FULL_32_12]|nr:MAG: hypothetical protein A2287_09885 [Candidatus Melainabacteria bacterium RIFOXYA12_FULL_32_12]
MITPILITNEDVPEFKKQGKNLVRAYLHRLGIRYYSEFMDENDPLKNSIREGEDQKIKIEEVDSDKAEEIILKS